MKNLIKKVVSALVSVVMLMTTLSVSVFAADPTNGTCGDDLTWIFDTETGELSIEGTGAMYNYAYGNRPWESSKDAIKIVTIGDGVTTIGNYAFRDCTNLTELDIPEGVTKIGDYTFYWCKSLMSISIPDSVTTIGDSAFFGCRGLTSVAIGNGVTSIKKYAFDDCKNLTRVKIPKSVTSIGEDAFRGCDKLEDYEVDVDNEYYSSDSYGVMYNKNKTELVQYPIGNERTDFIIPDSITTIGKSAFFGCNNLASVTIPDSVIAIGDYAFYNCDSITSVTIPDSVTTIGYRVFAYCNGLTSVTIPDSVTVIASYAFYWCDSLTDAYYSGTEDEWNEMEIGEYNEPLLNATIHYNYGKSSGNCGETLTWSFDEDRKVLSITGSGEMDNLASFEEYGWAYFKDQIEVVEFGNAAVSVGSNAFYGCPNLKEVYLSESIGTIGANAFADCPLLSLVTVSGAGFTADETSFSDNDERLVFLCSPANTQAADYAEEKLIKSITFSYDHTKKVMNFNGELTVYSDLPYTFLSKFVKQNPGMEYLYFEKLVFHGVEPEMIDINDLNNEASAQYLTFNKLYVSLKKVKDGSAEGVTFEDFLTLLENGDYDSFMFELVSQEGKQQLTFEELWEKVTDHFITSALRITSKIINFFRKIFR